MKTLYLINSAENQAQSGESADDVNPILSRRGETQAEALREQFAGLNFGRVYLSPLLRAWMTYKLSGVAARAVTVTSYLVEDPLGRQGFYEALVESDDPAVFPGDEDAAWYVDPRLRAKRFLAKVAKEKVNTLCVFGHWAIFNQVLQTFLGYEDDIHRRRMMLDNCGVAKLIIEPDGSRIVEYWNRSTID